jgi:uncharacterized protein YjbI with pentapeptide repeats
MKTTAYTTLNTQHQQRTGVDIPPEAFKQSAELAIHTAQQVGHFINRDIPAIRNVTTVMGTVLAGVGGWFALVKYLRDTPGAKFAKLSEGVQAQKTELEDPIVGVFEALETVSQKCAEFVLDETLHYNNTIEQAQITQLAKRSIRSMVVREKESTEFGTGSMNKSGLSLATLYMQGLNATPVFPQRNRGVNKMARILKNTPLNVWAKNIREKRIRELPILRRDQKNIQALARFEAKVKPIRRLNLEQVKAPYGEWRNWNTPYANLRKIDAYAKKFTWNDFTGSDFSEANLEKSRWFFNDVPEANFRGANLKETRLARINAKGADFSPYVENAYNSENNVIHPTNMEGVHINVTDYEPLLTDEWYNVENDFSGANLQGVNLRNSLIQQANFENASFHAPFFEDIQHVKNPTGKRIDEYQLYKPEENVWVRVKDKPQATDFTSSVWGNVNANGIEAQGVKFDNMRFLNIIPQAVEGQLGKKHTVTFRIEKECPIVPFANAKLQNSSWKGVELLKVDANNEVLEDAKPALSFAGANLSGVKLGEATINGENVQDVLKSYISEDGASSKQFKAIFEGSVYSKGQNPFETPVPYSHLYVEKCLRNIGVKQKGF